MVPILIVLLAGVIDLGNGFQTWINLTNAAREGARKAMVVSDATTICTYTRDELTATGIGVPCGNVAIQYPGVGGADAGSCAPGVRREGCPVRVQVAYAMNTFLGQVFGVNTITITSYVDMIVFSV